MILKFGLCEQDRNLVRSANNFFEKNNYLKIISSNNVSHGENTEKNMQGMQRNTMLKLSEFPL